jgi:hypothetical protein
LTAVGGLMGFMQHRPPALVADVISSLTACWRCSAGGAVCFFPVLRLATLMVAHRGAKPSGGHSILPDGGGRGRRREIAGRSVAMIMVLPVDPGK